jgi:hypothetical protein
MNCRGGSDAVAGQNQNGRRDDLTGLDPAGMHDGAGDDDESQETCGDQAERARRDRMQPPEAGKRKEPWWCGFQPEALGSQACKDAALKARCRRG